MFEALIAEAGLEDIHGKVVAGGRVLAGAGGRGCPRGDPPAVGCPAHLVCARV